MRGRCGVQQRGAAPGPRSRQAGLTLFELVVFILVVSIIFAYGFNRFREYPGAAERANFLAVTAQLKAGVNLRMMNAIASGDFSTARELEGSNPMDLMLEVPRNYVGSFAIVDEGSMPRRTWYFDEQAGELVYLANDSTQLYELREGGRRVPSDDVRLRINNVYEQDVRNGNGARRQENGTSAVSPEDGESDAPRGRRWQGLRLEAVQPYSWDTVELRIQGGEVAGSG